MVGINSHHILAPTSKIPRSNGLVSSRLILWSSFAHIHLPFIVDIHSFTFTSVRCQPLVFIRSLSFVHHNPPFIAVLCLSFVHLLLFYVVIRVLCCIYVSSVVLLCLSFIFLCLSSIIYSY